MKIDSTIKIRSEGKTISIHLPASAPFQVQPIPRIEELCAYWKKKGCKTVVDVGCGKLRNALVLIDYFQLWVCDFPEQLEDPVVSSRFSALKANRNFMGIIPAQELPSANLRADAAVLAFILHTLPSLFLRTQLLRTVKANLRAPYEVFVGVPNAEYYYRQRMHSNNQLNDGYLFRGRGKTTFYRDYSAKQIDGFMGNLGYRFEKSFSVDKKNLRTYISC